MSNTDSLSAAPDSLVRTGTTVAPGGAAKQAITTSGAADHIVAYPWGGHPGQAVTVTYAFRDTGLLPSGVGTGFSPFSASQIAAAQKALTAWSDVANIHFTRVDDGSGYSANATILFGDYMSGTGAGDTYFPGSTFAGASAGDVWINGSLSYNQAPTVGNYGGQVLIHEIGHAIGLSHPGDYDVSTGPATYAADAEYFEDSRQYSVMSYFDESATGANYGSRYSAAPLIDDITSVQRLYGANMAAFTGDTTYGFHSNAGREWFAATGATSSLIFAVWDASGSDTFDFSGFGQTQRIDLRAGDFSDVGGLHGNVAIAYGATIENAIGGSGADTIIGNQAANLVDGGAGQDSLYGETGNDTLRGGGGNDQLDGGSGSDWLDGGDGNDLIVGTPGVGPAGSGGESDFYLGGAGSDTINGGAGNDHIYGNAPTSVAGAADGADSLSGGNGNDYIQGNVGADTIDGGSGNDHLYGGADNDMIGGGDGADWLQGNKGADSLSGGIGDDTIHGGADNDTLAGGAGIDHVSGDAGNDRFLFGAGDATFVTGDVAFATDHITDFGNGWDLIQLPFHVAALLDGTATSAAEAYASAEALLAGHALDVAAIAVGADTMLFYHGDGTAGVPDSAITLDHVMPSVLTLASFA